MKLVKYFSFWQERGAGAAPDMMSIVSASLGKRLLSMWVLVRGE